MLPRCLLLAPFNTPQAVRVAVANAAVGAQMSIMALDNLPGGALWANQIQSAILASDLVVADITGQNPNVYYELGIAHALGRQAILIVRGDTLSSLPSDLAGFQVHVYDLASLNLFQFRLQQHIAQIRAWAGQLR